MIERAFAAGCIGAGATPGRRFHVKLTDPADDHGFAVQAVVSGDPLERELVASGYADYTAELDDALEQLRAP
jgi:hypothetical protein